MDTRGACYAGWDQSETLGLFEPDLAKASVGKW